MLRQMREREIPVVIGADAHQPERVAGDFDQGLERLREAGYSMVSNFLDRQRIDLPIDAAQASLESQQV
jgi:histidinol-phosphatase (PHP family)